MTHLRNEIMRRWLAFLSTFAVFGIAVGCYLYLFRQEVEDQPRVGLITHKYRWGIPRELLLDVNRDGKTDARYLVAAEFGGYSPQTDLFLEGWESLECDGRVDLHFVWDESGEIQKLERDVDRDGEYDMVLLRAEARKYLEALKRPGCNRADEETP